MIKQALHAAVLASLAICGAALAQPSGGFYLLKNKESGKVLCSQNPISPDWVRQAGPFKDQDCMLKFHLWITCESLICVCKS